MVSYDAGEVVFTFWNPTDVAIHAGPNYVNSFFPILLARMFFFFFQSPAVFPPLVFPHYLMYQRGQKDLQDDNVCVSTYTQYFCSQINPK